MKRQTDPDVLLLQAAADPTRLAILRLLATEDSICACEFVSTGDLAQPTVSHHLRFLRETGWVTSERRGTWVWYALRPEASARLRRLAELLSPGPSATATRAGSSLRRLPVIPPPS